MAGKQVLRALDLYCGAGGATRGLQIAGFHVTGVDINPQPHYCGDAFIQADALTVNLDGYDFVWASPICQKFTAYKRRPGHVPEYPDLIPQTRERLQAQTSPWIMENILGSSLQATTMLCGSSFGLDVRRHRYFEGSVPLLAPSCNHAAQRPRFAQATNRANLRRTVEVGVWRIPLAVQQRAMGIDWMDLEELSEAIPPAYSKYIGEWIMRSLHG